MALHKETFRKRTITAVVFAACMLAGLFMGRSWFIVLCAIIMFGCLYEFSKLIKLIHPRKYLLYLPIAFLYIIMPVMMLIDLGVNPKFEAIISSWKGENPFYSPLFPCAIIFSIWINDTMAYIVGSFIGKTPFSPISPKKTWEGTIGGAVLAVIVIGTAGYFIHPGNVPPLHWAIIALLCAVFGTLGDLLESKIKRLAGVKDSGTFMPGHGGFLDRFDSLLIATPLVWAYVMLA